MNFRTILSNEQSFRKLSKKVKNVVEKCYSPSENEVKIEKCP